MNEGGNFVILEELHTLIKEKFKNDLRNPPINITKFVKELEKKKAKEDKAKKAKEAKKEKKPKQREKSRIEKNKDEIYRSLNRREQLDFQP